MYQLRNNCAPLFEAEGFYSKGIKMLKKLFLIIGLFAFQSLYADEQKLVDHKKWQPGHKSLSTENDTLGFIPIMVWYPTDQPAKTEQFGVFRMKVAANAPLSDGKFPLAIISHGSGGSILGHRSTALYLAERGYIVATLMHPHNNYQDNRDEATTNNWINRPKHISAVLDTILANKEFASHVDIEKIAVIGYSAGGYTALTLLGGIPNTAHSRTHCIENAKKDPGFCNLGKGKESRNKDMILTDLRDERFKVGVLLAPVGVLFSDKDSLSKVAAPVLLYRAQNDRELAYPYHVELISKSLAKSSTWLKELELEKAEHFAFITSFPDFLKKEVGPPAHDPAGFDRDLAHTKFNAEIAVFLDKALKYR